jgi:hypothetical protein
MTACDFYYFGGPRSVEEMVMDTDTRASVTTAGTAKFDADLGWAVMLDDEAWDAMFGVGLYDGAEVEVTIRKHERYTTGSDVPAPEGA